jgi:hypothetical protein
MLVAVAMAGIDQDHRHRTVEIDRHDRLVQSQVDLLGQSGVIDGDYRMRLFSSDSIPVSA